jgi:phosphoribosylformylglycinamidine synthase subunit PurL
MSTVTVETGDVGVTEAQLAEVALNRAEYGLAVSLLGRAPGGVELGIIGALWSEHCGYKTSKPLLSRLPTTGPGVLQGPGENAGAVDIGNGLAVVFKIESHNHPSAVEPYQGAATGVGGILRDIFTMGARPVALLDSLRFGPLNEPKQQRLLDGVVAGIGGYGNCIGVPTVGGEVYFDPSYRHNCLVNAMCVGVIEQRKLTFASASLAGSTVLLVGADTGRDGIHGATFASVAMDENVEERRPAVQVGNPFLEKCLTEACLELAGHPRVIAIQDLGAAGLTSSTAELAHRGGAGIDIDVAKVSRRERGMTPYEVMLSESQERMLIVVEPGHEDEVTRVFDKWDLHSDVIGNITATGALVVRDGGDVVADLPLDMLVDQVPLRRYEVVEPERVAVTTPLTEGIDVSAALLRLLAVPNIGSRRPIYRRYDHQVGDDTVIGPGGDAALIRVDGTNTALALSTDGNGRYCARDPRVGAQIAVCEAARNVVATGAAPLAITNCLNFGNPEKPEIYWQLAQAIDGISGACKALDIPVVSGNVSLYNDTSGVSIDPTPVIGMVGKLEDLGNRLGYAFTDAGDEVAVIGPECQSLSASEFALAYGGDDGLCPALDLDAEQAVQEFVLSAAADGLLSSAHDCAEGGLAVAAAECCLAGGLGLDAGGEDLGLPQLFGEGQSRFVISYRGDNAGRIDELALETRVRLQRIGKVDSGGRLQLGAIDVDLVQARNAFDGALVQVVK